MPSLRPFFLKMANFQDLHNYLLDFIPQCCVFIWCKFQLIWTKIEGADTFGVKYHIVNFVRFFVRDPTKIANFKI